MDTILVRMSCDPRRRDEVQTHLHNDVAPWARRQPGFVDGRWLLGGDGASALGVVTFRSRAEAEEAASGPRSYPNDPTRAWRIDAVEVVEVVEVVSTATP